MELIFSFTLWLFGVFNFETPPPYSQAPTINFRYANYIDDLVCPIAKILSPTASKEASESFAKYELDLEENSSRFHKLWDGTGPKLLTSTSALIKTRFGYHSKSVALFFCPHISSWSLPRIVPVWQYLPSTPKEKRWSDSEFIDGVYHSQLHMLIFRTLKWRVSSPLLIKYKHEDLYTKTHLHLYAVQKEVYRQNGKNDIWKDVVARTKTLSKSYQRAIEIVELEGAEAFINELKIAQY
jgi:hypothetical protein